MTAVYVCDWCGRKADAAYYSATRYTTTPAYWFSRADDDIEQHACSRHCLNELANATGVTSVVLP